MPDAGNNLSYAEAGRAIALMRDNEIQPTPTAYDFWYRYVSKSDAALVDAIDQLIARNGRITSRTMDRLRVELWGKSDSDPLMALMEATQNQLNQMSALVSDASGNARSYHGELTDGNEALRQSSDPEHQRQMVEQLIASTQSMIEKTARLEAQLSSSGNEIKVLRDELEKARSESRTDALTGLANRKAFNSYLEANAGRALADKRPLSLVFCDIDHFKKFNDTWGHRMGDEILRLVGRSLEHLCNGIGFPARYGGEEFVIVFPDRKLQAAADMAEQVRDFISNKTVRTKQSQQSVGRVTMSFGVAELTWNDRVEDLVERADAALYHAKRTGRNKVCLESELPAPGSTDEPLKQAG